MDQRALPGEVCRNRAVEVRSVVFVKCMASSGVGIYLAVPDALFEIVDAVDRHQAVGFAEVAKQGTPDVGRYVNGREGLRLVELLISDQSVERDCRLQTGSRRGGQQSVGPADAKAKNRDVIAVNLVQAA